MPPEYIQTNQRDSSDKPLNNEWRREADPGIVETGPESEGATATSTAQNQRQESSRPPTSNSNSVGKPSARNTSPFSVQGTGASPTFPVKLHKILSNPEFESIVQWLPHGRAWRILDSKALQQKIIPLYFRHGRYSSFARQINGWGFRRVVHGADYNAYYHEMFLRGMPELCAKMKRPTSKKRATRDHINSMDAAPDFYAMSRLQPLPEPGPSRPPAPTRAANEVPQGVHSHHQLHPEAATSSPSDASLQDLLQQIASILRNAGQTSTASTPGEQGGDELYSVLSLLAGEQTAPPPPPVAPPSPTVPQNHVLQQLLAGLSDQVAATNPAPQIQLTTLLQQNFQPTTQPSPQELLAALLNPNTSQRSPDDIFINILHMQQNPQPSDILQALLNHNQSNPASMIQALTNQLQQQYTSAGTQHPPPPQMQESNQSSGRSQSSGRRPDSASQEQCAVAAARPQSVPSHGNQSSSVSTDALSQLMSFIAPNSSSLSNNTLDISNLLRQMGQKTPSQESQGSSALLTAISLLGDGRNQSSFFGSQGTSRSQGGIYEVLHGLLAGNGQSQMPIPDPAAQGGEHLLRDLQNLVVPTQPAIPEASSPLLQLQRLLVSQNGNSHLFPSSTASSQFGYSQEGATNPTAAIVQQLWNASSARPDVSSSAHLPQSVTADILASLGFQMNNQSSGTGAADQGNAQSQAPLFNQEMVIQVGGQQSDRTRDVSDSSSITSSSNSACRTRGEGSSANVGDRESTEVDRSVADILAKFSKGN